MASRRPIDGQLLADTEYPRLLLNVDGLQRSLRPRAIWRSLNALPKLIIATAIATRRMRLWRPRVVVSVGGFASEPATRAARALGIPVVVVSYDQHPGLATRRQAKHAAAVAAAFAGSRLPGAKHTGAPVRHDIRRLVRNSTSDPSARERAAHSFGIDPRRRIIVAMGGSLGSRIVNAAVEGWVGKNLDRSDVAVVHLTGDRYVNDEGPQAPSAGIQYVRRASHGNMADVWRICDVLVSRAGASTIAELVTVGSPAVIIPWGEAADDHQRSNADWLASAGAAVVVTEDDLDAGFDRELSRLVDDDVARERLAAKSYALGALNRSSAVGSLIESAAR